MIKSIAVFLLTVSVFFCHVVSAATCPKNPSQANQQGWRETQGNHPDFGSDTFIKATWQPNAGQNILTCIYKSINFPFPAAAYHTNIAKPTQQNWLPSRTNHNYLVCQDSIDNCTFNLGEK
ncbi:MAG: hypothetical protein AAGG80_00870 [Pseudomonadota bacterium]